MRAALLTASTRWDCPNCPVTDVTAEARPHTRFHSCAGLGGLSVPLVAAGTRCKIEAIERGDYLGRDAPGATYDDTGRPIMAVITTRDDGQDCTVYAPTALARMGDTT